MEFLKQLLERILKLLTAKKDPVVPAPEEVKPIEVKRLITIQRTDHQANATLGELKISWEDHAPIYTMENPQRATSVDNRIPAGTYNCIPYSGAKYKDVYLVEDVPGRSAILMHWGNTEKDTLGCILLGNKIGKIGQVPAVLESKICYARFVKLVGKESFTLVIKD